MCLDDADLVCNIKSIVVSGQTYVSLLLTIGSEMTTDIKLLLQALIRFGPIRVIDLLIRVNIPD